MKKIIAIIGLLAAAYLPLNSQTVIVTNTVGVSAVGYCTLTFTDGFNTGSGWRASDPRAPSGVNGAFEFSVPFICGTNGPLSAIQLPLSRTTITSTNLRTFTLALDVGGKPGIPLESWSIMPTSAVRVMSLNSVNRPSIIIGEKYWLTATLNPMGTASDNWYMNTIGVNGRMLYRRSSTAAWSAFIATFPAFRISIGDQVTFTLSSNREPTAVMTAFPLTGKAPLTVTFSGAGSSDPDGTIVDYSWSFGDGGTGKGSTFVYTYRVPGSYSPVLTVTDNEGGQSK